MGHLLLLHNRKEGGNQIVGEVDTTVGHIMGMRAKVELELASPHEGLKHKPSIVVRTLSIPEPTETASN